MKSEEKLNLLFETLKAEKSTTRLADVTSWIEAPLNSTYPKSTNKSFIQKNIFIMSSITTTVIIGGILIFSGNQEVKNTQLVEKYESEILSDPQESVIENVVPEKKKSDAIEETITQYYLESIIPSFSYLEFKNTSEKVQIDFSDSKPLRLSRKNRKKSGSWFSTNDSLSVDTIFIGVKSLVFSGDVTNVKVLGSDRDDIALQYHFGLKNKGGNSSKIAEQCELSYVIEDSVLTIHLKRKSMQGNLENLVNHSSEVEFNIPENIALTMESEVGDISTEGIRNELTHLHTSVGDITAKNMQGLLDFHTEVGDVSLDNFEGMVNCKTSVGDITLKNIQGTSDLKADNGDISIENLTGKVTCSTDIGQLMGEKIWATGDCIFQNSIGDIDIQILNSLSEVNLHLNTIMGKIKVVRPEFKSKSTSHLIAGNGKISIKMETSIGKVLVR